MLNYLTHKLMAWLSNYSMQREEVVGVDITPGYIRVAQLENADKKWTLSKLSYKKIEGQETAASIHESRELYVERLKSAIQSAKVTTSNAALSIPVSNAIVQVVTLPLMTDEELKGAIETDSLWENVIQMAEELDDYSIFWQVIRRNTAENKMELLFVASKVADVNFYADIVRDAGLTPVILNVRCFALKNALEIQGSRLGRDRPIAIIEVGAHENYVMVLHEDAPFISGIFVSDADKTALADPQLNSERCSHITDRLAMQVRQTLSTFESKFGGVQVTEAQLITTAPNYEIVRDGLMQSLRGITVGLFDPLHNLRVPQHLSEKVAAEPNPSVFASCLGLASRKLDVFGYYQYVSGAGASSINLLPDWDRVRSSQKRKLMAKFAGAGALLVLVAGLAYATILQHEAQATLAQGATEYDQLNARKQGLLQQIAAANKQRHQFGGLLEASKGLSSNSAEMYDLLLDVTRKIPEGVWLESMTYSGEREVQVAGKSVSDQNILQFIAQLNTSEFIARASLNTMTLAVQSGREIKKFDLTATLKPLEPADAKDGGAAK